MHLAQLRPGHERRSGRAVVCNPRRESRTQSHAGRTAASSGIATVHTLAHASSNVSATDARQPGGRRRSRGARSRRTSPCGSRCRRGTAAAARATRASRRGNGTPAASRRSTAEEKRRIAAAGEIEQPRTAPPRSAKGTRAVIGNRLQSILICARAHSDSERDTGRSRACPRRARPIVGAVLLVVALCRRAVGRRRQDRLRRSRATKRPTCRWRSASRTITISRYERRDLERFCRPVPLGARRHLPEAGQAAARPRSRARRRFVHLNKTPDPRNRSPLFRQGAALPDRRRAVRARCSA